jgi:hypothetical protein
MATERAFILDILDIRRDGDSWAFDLMQDDGTDYTVWLGAHGERQCGCPAFAYNRGPVAACKHTTACAELRDILLAMANTLTLQGASW